MTLSEILSGVRLKQPTEPFPALDRAVTSLAGGCHGHEHDMTVALMGTLRLIMRDVLFQDVSEGVFSKQNYP